MLVSVAVPETYRTNVMAVGASGFPLESTACAVPLIEFALPTEPLKVVRPVCSVSETLSPL
jgi:hypothetical protein